MISDGVGVTSAAKAIGLLSAMFNRAIVWGFVERNPCDHVERPRSNGKRRIQALSPAQIEAIRSQMEIRDATLVSVLGLSGLRPGEALALEWTDVANTIHVYKSLAHGAIKGTKTSHERSVRLLPSLKRDLDEWRLSLGRPEEGYIFATRTGRPWSDSTYRDWRKGPFASAVQAIGLPKTTRPYDLRHSFASLLLASGASLPEAAYEMGHSVGVLTSTYAHEIAEFRGQGPVDPETAIQAARSAIVAA
jgi:integrase